LEDHHGIFEVSLNGNIIYSNHQECCQEYLPENIVKDIGESIASGKLSKRDLPRKSGKG
jgi:hypothetical protein